MNRHQIREQIVFVLYQHLLLNEDIEKRIDCVYCQFDDFAISVFDDIKNNEISYITDISMYLKDWSFDRLNYVDQAILLESASELKRKINDKAIIIDEAIRIAKIYSDETSYKYINGVLDKL